MRYLLGFWCLTGSAVALAAGPFIERPEVLSWMSEVIEQHQLSRDHVVQIVTQAKHRPEVIAHARAPAESMPWHRYRKIFLTQSRIQKGRQFLAEYAEPLQAAQTTYGVPPEIVAAIIGVESFYGRNTGTHPVVDALMTLGFDYPPRAAFFRKQMEHLLLLEREAGLRVTTLRSSWAGALGQGQFIPSSYRHFTVDGDGDGRRDLWDSPPDIIASIANYFHSHHWRPGAPIAEQITPVHPPHLPISEGLKPEIEPVQLVPAEVALGHLDAGPVAVYKFEMPQAPEYWVGYHNFYVITRYNHSALYALAVYQLSEALRNDPS